MLGCCCVSVSEVGVSSIVTSTLNSLVFISAALPGSEQPKEPGIKIRVRLGPRVLMRFGLSEKTLRLEVQNLEINVTSISF